MSIPISRATVQEMAPALHAAEELGLAVEIDAETARLASFDHARIGRPYRTVEALIEALDRVRASQVRKETYAEAESKEGQQGVLPPATLTARVPPLRLPP